MTEEFQNAEGADEVRGDASAVSGASAQTAAAEELSADALLAQKDVEIGELKKELLYQRAEFENFRKRTEKRYRDALEFATEPLIKELLPVLDNLERAIAHARELGAANANAVAEGLDHVAGQFRRALGNHGVEDVLAYGEKFDPNLHESLSHVPGEQDNLVAEVYEKGYLLKGRLLRPAKVAISRVATPQSDG